MLSTILISLLVVLTIVTVKVGDIFVTKNRIEPEPVLWQCLIQDQVQGRGPIIHVGAIRLRMTTN